MDKNRETAIINGIALEGTVVLGDWVRTQYGQIGRVHAIHHTCPESESWQKGQTIPVTFAQRYAPWVSVLVQDGGAVVQPIETVTVLSDDEHPAMLRNNYAKMYFGEVTA